MLVPAIYNLAKLITAEKITVLLQLLTVHKWCQIQWGQSLKLKIKKKVTSFLKQEGHKIGIVFVTHKATKCTLYPFFQG